MAAAASSSSTAALRRCLQGLRLSPPALSPAATRQFTSSVPRPADDHQPSSQSSKDSSSQSPDSDPNAAANNSSAAAQASSSKPTTSTSESPLTPEDQTKTDTAPSSRGRKGARSSSSKDRPSFAPPGHDIPPPMSFDDLSSFPSILFNPHPILDSGNVHHVAPTANAPYGGSITVYNDPKYFRPSGMTAADIAQSDVAPVDGGDAGTVEIGLAEETSYSAAEIRKFHRHVLLLRRVIRMTGKGKIPSMSALMVVGNGKGMVGFGMGKDENAGPATMKAYKAAVKNMDYVKRFESRTIHMSLVGKWGATKVYMRPRPPGFGLRVPPSVHAIARSSGITDLSASITGSSNPINVCRAVLSALHSGAGPTAMGDGFGRKSRRSDRGQGPKTLEDLEVERGRRYRIVRS